MPKSKLFNNSFHVDYFVFRSIFIKDIREKLWYYFATLLHTLVPWISIVIETNNKTEHTVQSYAAINFVRKYLKMKDYLKNLLFSNARSRWRSPVSIHSLGLCYKMHKKSFDNKKVSTSGEKNTSNLKKKRKWIREKLFDHEEET